MRARHYGVQAQLFRWRLRFWLGIAIVVFLAGDAALWSFGTPALVTAMLRALMADETPMIATGASFSISAGSFTTRDRAEAFAVALSASGVPILLRTRPDDDKFQVLVGPYVSTDEAELAQRGLAAWGLGDARLAVDETMRRTQSAAVSGVGDGSGNGVLIVAAAGMSSVVFEMPDPPREVESRRTSATTLDIDIGHVTGAEPMERLSMPEGIVLARELRVATGESGRAMRAHLVVPAGVQSRVRLEGRRVYLDLAWPQAPWQVGSQALPATEEALGPTPASAPASTSAAVPPHDAGIGAYREQLHGAVARFEELRPFLLLAVRSPEPDVLAALAHSLDDLRISLAGVRPPPERAPNFQAMNASLVLAAGAMAPSFASDREAALTQAIAMFEANE